MNKIYYKILLNVLFFEYLVPRTSHTSLSDMSTDSSLLHDISNTE